MSCCVKLASGLEPKHGVKQDLWFTTLCRYASPGITRETMSCLIAKQRYHAPHGMHKKYSKSLDTSPKQTCAGFQPSKYIVI